MTGMFTDLGAQPLVERLGATLIHFVWQGTVVSAIVAILLHVFRQAAPQKRYVGLCVALISVALAPVATFLWLRADIQESPVADLKAPQVVTPGVGPALSETASPPGVVSLDSLTQKVAEAPFTAPADSGLRPWAPWIVSTWIAGVGVFSVWHLAGWAMARRLTTRCVRPATPVMQELLAQLSQRMEIRATIRLVESSATAVPLVVGWLKPVVVIPVSVLNGLPRDEVQSILAHELAHVRRHDFLVNVLQTVVETCLFYHPAVWWLSGRIRIEREYCADEDAAAVCADRETYARALVSLADAVTSVPHLAVAATGGTLSNRIHRVLGLTAGRERTNHSSWLISAVLGGLVLWGLLGPALSNDAPTKVTPIKEVGKKLANEVSWIVHQQDETPTVTVDGHQGYRLVLRRTWKEFTNLPQQQVAAPPADNGPFELRHEDWEFVLFPIRTPGGAPDALKARIPWRKSNSPYHTRDVALGQGLGYAWFTRGTLYGQESVRDSLKLEGGDDRVQLLMDGLQVKDAGTNTANSCLFLVKKFGDEAVPYVKRTVAQSRPATDLGRVILSLAFIQTDASTDLLLELYDSEKDDLRWAAEYALIHTPYRKAARKAYLDMLRRQSSVEAACAASVEFDWTEAVPILKEVIAKPKQVAYLKQAIPARRTLEGKPIAKEIRDAEQTLRELMRQERSPEQNQKIDAARQLLIRTEDTEGANLVALSLTLWSTKGNSGPVNTVGIEILRSRPPRSTDAFLEAVLAGVQGNDRDRDQLRLLLDVVRSARARADRRE